MEDRYGIGRFRNRQDFGVYEKALSEVKAGCKRSHWIWFIFPQIKGLPVHSRNATFYAISCVEEARDYLADPVLGPRLRLICLAMLQGPERNPYLLFGHVDAIKVRSCMTLFDYISPGDIFAEVLRVFYASSRDELTLNVIRAESRKRAATADDLAPVVYPESKGFTPECISELKPDEIFVFGSNLAGMHGAGAARAAVRHFGAVMGQGVGLQGRSYAIPTMQGGPDSIRPYVDQFEEFARTHPRLRFLVTRIGCGIAGFQDAEIAPLFRRAASLPNVILPLPFVQVLRANLN